MRIVMILKHDAVASVVLNKNQAPEYAQMAWQYPAEPEQALVIHTLCIPPELSGRGLASQMIDYAKTYAKEQNCLVIRLDTWAQNEPAKSLYQNNLSEQKKDIKRSKCAMLSLKNERMRQSTPEPET